MLIGYACVSTQDQNLELQREAFEDKVSGTRAERQGCIFRDGWSLWTQALEDRIDAISVKINGFYIGRYDLRYESLADLQNGTNFKILELNGAASEATSIYDAKNSIFTAYSTLFKQWHLVFTIGAANRALGHQSESISTLWSEYRRYQSQAAHHPVAD